MGSILQKFMKPADLKKQRYGLTKFERKLFNDWLEALGINNSNLSIEQRQKYIQYPGFQYLLEGYRQNKPPREILGYIKSSKFIFKILALATLSGSVLSYLVSQSIL